MAVMFPAANTSALLVVSCWGGKVSGIAFVNGKDANRNPTTREGKLENNVKHTLVLEVRSMDNNEVRITTTMDGEPYLNWQGPPTALAPDRQWGLRNSKAIGIGAYDADIVFHHCQVRALP